MQPNYQSIARIEYRHFQACKFRNLGVGTQENEGSKSRKQKTYDPGNRGSNAGENSRDFSGWQ